MSQAWVIASGKGGVGKTTLTAALGVALAKRRLQCCCVDTDMGLRSLDMLMGMQNKVVYDISAVAHKECKLKYALVRHAQYDTLSLLPAAQFAEGNEIDARELERVANKLKKRAAYVLLDAPAGLGRGLQSLLPASDHEIVVTTADDIAIRDAKQLIALMDERGMNRPMLIVNRVIPDMVLNGEMYSPQAVANELDAPLLGYIPEDRAVLAAANRHESFMEENCPAQAAMERVCRRFLGEYVPMPSFRKSRWPFPLKRR